MNLLIALLLLGPITGDQADQIARRFLAKASVPGPYRLQRLNGIDGSMMSAFNLAYTTKAGAYELYVRRNDGGVRLAIQTHPPLKDLGTMPAGRKDYLPAGRMDIQAVRFALKKLGLPGDAMGEAPGSTRGQGCVSVRMAFLAGGRRVFVGPMMVGVGLILAGKRVLSYDDSISMPRVALAEPRISADKAVEALRAAATPKDGRAKLFSFQPVRTPELIYYTPQASEPARLCWYVPAVVQIDVGYSVRGGGRTVLVDAQTGVPVEVAVQLSDGDVWRRP